MRVRLRPLRLDDVAAVHSWAQLLEVCRYQAWGPNTEEQTRAFVEAGVEAWAEVPQERFVHAIDVDGQALGIGRIEIRDAVHRQGEIAYSLHPSHWGLGITTTASRELLRIGFERLNLHRIFGTCDPRNLRSMRVLTKIGMSHEGRLRHTQLIRDGWRDSAVFSILRDEWRPEPGPASGQTPSEQP